MQTNPVSGKACSPTKGGLICFYMPPLLASQTTDLIALSLLHTYDLLYFYCYRLKKKQTDPGAPPWTMDGVDSELAKRLRGKPD